MIRLFFLGLVFACATSAMGDPVRFVEITEIEDQPFTIPMTIEMEAATSSKVVLKLAGDLTEVHAALPALLSRVIDARCDREIALAVSEARAIKQTLRLRGQLQATLWRCDDNSTIATRLPRLNQTADIETVLSGRMINGCLVMRVVSTDLDFDGFTGAILDVTGLTRRFNRRLEERLDKTLRDRQSCISLPEEFEAFDTQITGGRFLDIGDGAIGAEIDATMEITAANFIELIHILGQAGKLGD
jgi:hypothetical protein